VSRRVIASVLSVLMAAPAIGEELDPLWIQNSPVIRVWWETGAESILSEVPLALSHAPGWRELETNAAGSEGKISAEGEDHTGPYVAFLCVSAAVSLLVLYLALARSGSEGVPAIGASARKRAVEWELGGGAGQQAASADGAAVGAKR